MKQKAARTIIVVIAVAVLAACGVCEEDSLTEIGSPNGNYVAVVYGRNCGATSRLLRHVNIRKSWSWFSSDHRGVVEDGQVFLTDAGKLSVVWKDDKTLLIDCEGCPTAPAPLMKNSWEDVKISYQLH